MQYHHSMPLSGVRFGIIKGDKKYSDPDWGFEQYLWVEKQLGFYPLFIAVGQTLVDIHMTDYWAQFKRIIRKENGKSTYRAKGQIDNRVLFSFNDLPGIFTDSDIWNWGVLFNGDDVESISDYTIKRLFKKSWTKTQWLKKAKNEPHTVQMLIPEIDLRMAGRIWVRNIKTKVFLEKQGFKNVIVKRIKVPY